MEKEIVIRLATPSDTEAINSFYNNVYKSDRDNLKFNWEFNSSPAGPSIYVIAELEKRIVGTQCIIPYNMITSDNKTILSGKSEDTLVAQDQRGKKIFEKMYALLIEECKKKKIECIWGFTYATKPFFRLGFTVPFKSSMGLMVLNSANAEKYLSSRSSKNSALDKLKIKGLSYFSKLKGLTLLPNSSVALEVDAQVDALITSNFNYLTQQGTFGLKLDKEFMDYRISTNPYSSNYYEVRSREANGLKFSMVYHVSNDNVGYIIHLYASASLKSPELRKILAQSIRQSDLAPCDLIRFWGFDHNPQNATEIKLLKSIGFTFIKRGISFVWLNLSKESGLDPSNFVISRMASQGTD
ncbi:MAG: GNAT family N-acetyltransferase [bacterium]|nr:GNAT family N-acetyltransferase [bacterium]